MHLGILMLGNVPEQMIHAGPHADAVVHVVLGNEPIGLGDGIEPVDVVGTDLGLVEQIGNAVVSKGKCVVVGSAIAVLSLLRHGRVGESQHRSGKSLGLAILAVVTTVVPATLQLPFVADTGAVLGVASGMEPTVGVAATLSSEELESRLKDVVVDRLTNIKGKRGILADRNAIGSRIL